MSAPQTTAVLPPQPDFDLLSAGLNELHKLPNVPAIDSGNHIVAAMQTMNATLQQTQQTMNAALQTINATLNRMEHRLIASYV
jgi:hypothetical protein